MNPLSILKSLLISLQGEDDPSHVAAGFALGATLGLVPKGNFLAVIFLLMFFFFRVDKGIALLSALVFTPLGYLLDGPAHQLGLALLTWGALRPLWTWFYNMPVVPWTKFNNTVVMGNLALGMIFYAPLYFGSKRGVLAYRSNLRNKINQYPVVKMVKGLYVVDLYLKWSQKK